MALMLREDKSFRLSQIFYCGLFNTQEVVIIQKWKCKILNENLLNSKEIVRISIQALVLQILKKSESNENFFKKAF